MVLFKKMEATIIKYEANNLSKTEASKLSKILFGYKDRSNKGNYLYKRKGLIKEIPYILLTRGTFIIPKKQTQRIVNLIKKRKAKIKTWNINIKKDYFK